MDCQCIAEASQVAYDYMGTSHKTMCFVQEHNLKQKDNSCIELENCQSLRIKCTFAAVGQHFFTPVKIEFCIEKSWSTKLRLIKQIAAF